MSYLSGGGGRGRSTYIYMQCHIYWRGRSIYSVISIGGGGKRVNIQSYLGNGGEGGGG